MTHGFPDPDQNGGTGSAPSAPFEFVAYVWVNPIRQQGGSVLEKDHLRMNMNIKQRIASGALAVALLGGTGASVAAQDTDQTQRGGAAGLVAAVVQAQLDDTVNIEVVDSLNNLTALNNILNNSPILSNNDIDVVVRDIDVDVLNISVGDVTVEDVLNDNNIAIDDVVGVALLSGGDVIILT